MHRIVLILAGAASAACGQSYSVFELPSPAAPAAPFTAARSVQNGVAVGRASFGTGPGGAEYRMRWVQQPSGAWQGEVLCGTGFLDTVNAAGTIVGGYSGFIYENGVCANLPTPPGMLGGAFEFDINQAGDRIVGWVLTSTGPNVHNAAVWTRTGGGPWVGTALPTLGGSDSVAWSIDEGTGRLGGWSHNPSNTISPVNWSASGQITALPYTGLGAAAFGVSAGGRSCGILFVDAGPTEARAVVWQGGPPQVLDPLAGLPHAVLLDMNDDGVAVGWAYDGHPLDNWLWNVNARAVIYRGSALVDLNTLIPGGSGWVLREAWSINEVGEIAGNGALNGAQRGFILIPCMPDCDSSGSLNIDDFLCFQLKFALQDPYADCDGNSQFNIDDFLCFQLAFALGC